MTFTITPYRFSLVRILFGIYLIAYNISEIIKNDEVMSPSIYVGLSVFALLLLLGYQRQIVSRALIFFSVLLFIFKRSEFHLHSDLVLSLLLLFAMIPGDEPWQIKDSTKLSSAPLVLNRGYFWITLVLIVGLLMSSFIFNRESISFSNWSIYSLLILIVILFFPAFIFKAKVKSTAPILFFDGVCGLCSHFVDFVFAEDTAGVFKVAAIQGKTAQEKLPAELRTNLNTVIILDSDQLYVRSEAILNLLYDIGGFWRLLFIFRILPRPFCDLFYNLVARFRYNIFGQKETCRLPTPTEKEQFLN